MTYQDHTKAWHRLRRAGAAVHHKGLLARVREAMDAVSHWRKSRALAREVAWLTVRLRELEQCVAAAEKDAREAHLALDAERLIKQQLLATMTAPW